jgi:hypothetical protein
MATTTAYAIRTSIASAIRDVVPALFTGVRFLEHDYQLDFREWCEANPQACFRRFAVREDGVAEPALVSNGDVEWRAVDFEITIAYPRDTRFGSEPMSQPLVDLDRVVESDQDLIESAIGIRAGIPDAAVIRDGTSMLREVLNGVEVLSIRQRMGHYRSY